MSITEIARVVLSLLFIGIGILHFLTPKPFVAIMPRFVPEKWHLAAVYLSGVAEISGGVGLHVAPLRTAAGIGLLALLVAIFPANVKMLADARKNPKASRAFVIGLWIRLPFQPLIMAWVWWVSRA